MRKTPKYQIVITNYLNGITDFSSIRNLGSREKIINYLIHYKKEYPSFEEKINNLLLDLDKMLKLMTMKKRKYKYVDVINKSLKNKDISILKQLGKREYVICCLDNYLFMFPEKVDEIEKIKYEFDILYRNRKYINNINKYIDSKFRDFDLLLELGDKSKIMKCLNKFKKEFKNKSKDVNYIINNYDKLWLKNRYESKKPLYVCLIEKYLDGDKEAIIKLKKFGNKIYMFKLFDRYCEIYPDKKEEIDMLKEEYNKGHVSNVQKYNYERIIENYFKTDNFTPLLFMGSKTYILNCLKKYMINHPESVDKINYIIENFKELSFRKLDTHTFKKFLEFKISNEYLNYVQMAYELLYISEDEAVNMLVKKNVDSDQLLKAIKKFKINFPNQVDEIDKLEKIYSELSKKFLYKNNRKSYIDKSIFLEKTINEVYDEEQALLLDIYNSNLSIEEYCSNNGNSIDVLKRLCNKNVDSKISKDILSRDNKVFKKYMCELGKIILQSNEFDMLDYYTYTRLRYVDFKNELFKLFAKDDVVKIIKKVKNINKVNNNIVSKNEQLKMKTVIAGREITEDEINKIFNYLEENNYPFSLYRIALKKYVNGSLDFGMQKKKF